MTVGIEFSVDNIVLIKKSKEDLEMIKFKIGTTTNRYEVVADAASTTLTDAAAGQGISTSGVTFHVDGVPVDDPTESLASLGVKDGSMVMVIPAQKAGC